VFTRKKIERRALVQRLCVGSGIALAVLLSAASRGEDLGYSGIGREEGCALLAKLQGAVRANDVEALSQLVEYPLRVYEAGRSSDVSDLDGLRRSYASIFTPQVRNAVLKQDCATLLGNWRGG
jgi:hypothetical protein